MELRISFTKTEILKIQKMKERWQKQWEKENLMESWS